MSSNSRGSQPPTPSPDRSDPIPTTSTTTNRPSGGSSSSPPKQSVEHQGPRSTTGTRTWSQVVQGIRRFKWESSRATKADIEALEARFSQIVSFSADEFQRTSSRWKLAIIGKFLGKGFLWKIYPEGDENPVGCGRGSPSYAIIGRSFVVLPTVSRDPR